MKTCCRDPLTGSSGSASIDQCSQPVSTKTKYLGCDSQTSLLYGVGHQAWCYHPFAQELSDLKDKLQMPLALHAPRQHRDGGKHVTSVTTEPSCQIWQTTEIISATRFSSDGSSSSSTACGGACSVAAGADSVTFTHLIHFIREELKNTWGLVRRCPWRRRRRPRLLLLPLRLEAWLRPLENYLEFMHPDGTRRKRAQRQQDCASQEL